MSLKKEYQRELSSILSSITLDKVTKFPISNTKDVPIAYMSYEVVLKTKDKVFGFSLQEAIEESQHQESVIILENNGMHFYYTPTLSKQQLWIPAVYDIIKDTIGTLLILQNFPNDGECVTKFLKEQEIDDASMDAYRDLDVIIFNDANFYVQRENLANLAKISNELWRKDMLVNTSGLTTLQHTN